MRIQILLTAVATIGLAPLWASEPGQPLDCEDFVFLEPGLSCHAFSAPSTADSAWSTRGHNKAIDNTGQLLIVRQVAIGHCENPACCNSDRHRTEVVRFDGDGETVLGYVDDRCLGGNVMDEIEPRGEGVLTFDDKSGSLLIPLLTRCRKYQNPGTCPYDENGFWIAEIRGFATTFDILQTYHPATNQLSFRVPYMPEGLSAADWFDTYWGYLSSVGDWSQAQSLHCGYPATAPEVGDFLVVEDKLPTPPPGDGYYYVTAVRHSGTTRFGRQSRGGVLTGRDPAALAACENGTGR